ncbi:MAG TPA: hypothetical protein VJZ27_06715, partial [Aggregatilineales bacterium]|nr:hypothetical protein [Aggregatilineales bacterium]
MAQEALIRFENVTKIFGPNPDSIHPLIAAGLSQAEIHEQTRHVVAVRDVSFSIAVGEFFVVMGLSG